MNDRRSYIKDSILLQEAIRDTANVAIERLNKEYAEHEKELPLVWVIVSNSGEGRTFGASRNKFDTEQIWMSSNNYMEAWHVKEMTTEEADAKGIEYQ